MSTQSDLLHKSLETLPLVLTEEQAALFVRFHDLLVEANRTMNLTTVTEWSDAVFTHYADSLSAVLIHDFSKDQKVLDVGTGAGFPGIPLAICHPGTSFILLDSLNKRVRFLEEASERLGLQNVRAIHGRAEELARDPAHREAYDCVVSRAVASMNVLSEYCIPYVNLNGVFLAYKTEKAREEIRQAKKAVAVLGGAIEEERSFNLNGADRLLVAVRKQKKTPAPYPRKAGTPGKSPIR